MFVWGNGSAHVLGLSARLPMNRGLKLELEQGVEHALKLSARLPMNRGLKRDAEGGDVVVPKGCQPDSR